MQQRKENTAAKHPDNNLEDNDLCSSATSHASEQGWLTGMRRRKRQRRRGFSFLKAKCRAADRVHRQAHTPHLSSPLGTRHLPSPPRLSPHLLRRPPCRGCRQAGCRVFGRRFWWGGFGWASQLLLRTVQRRTERRRGRTEDSNGVMSGW